MKSATTKKVIQKKQSAAEKPGSADMQLYISRWANLVRRMGWIYHCSIMQMSVQKPVMEILMHLYFEKGDVEPSVIADCVHMPRQTVTSILDTMEAKKYIVRLPHPSDRRKKLIRLSKAGIKIADDSIKTIRKHERKALELLSNDEIEQMLKSLNRYCDALEGSVGIKLKKEYLCPEK